MLLMFIRARLAHYGLHQAALWAGFVLVAGFGAFLPLYQGTQAEAYLRDRLAQTPAGDFQITLRDDTPLAPELERAYQERLGDMAGDITRYQRSQIGANEAPTFGYVCSQRYTQTADGQQQFSTEQNCHTFTVFENARDYFTLSTGDWPGESETPGVLVSTVVQNRLDVTVGDYLTLNGADNQPFLTVQIAGLFEPQAPDSPIWEGQNNLLNGNLTVVSADGGLRYDYGLLVTPELYETAIAPHLPAGTNYFWRLQTHPNALHAADLSAQRAALRAFEQDFSQFAPQGELNNPAAPLLATIQTALDERLSALSTLGAALMLLLIGTLFAVAEGGRRRAHQEWAWLHERGSAVWQVVGVQAVSLFGLALIAAALSPFIAEGVLHLLSDAPITRALPDSLLYGAIAAGLGWLACSAGVGLWYWETHQAGESPARPPLPARYGLDMAALSLGVLLFLRLYLVTTGNLSGGLSALLRDPLALFRQQEGLSLSDPFTLAAPVFLLMGGALLWLRLLPLLLRLLSPALGRFLPLQWVAWAHGRGRLRGAFLRLWLLTLIAAVLVAALSLTRARQQRLWEDALTQTGQEAVIPFTGAIPDWQAWDGVQAAAPLMTVTEADTFNAAQVMGVDVAALRAAFPEQADALALLTEDAPPALPGIPLPSEAVGLSVQVYSEVGETPVAVGLAFTIEDAFGAHQTLPLRGEAVDERFTAYATDLPAALQAPWRLTGLTLTSRAGDSAFEHVLFLDALEAVLPDGERVLVDGFEESVARWIPNRNFGQRGAVPLQSSTQAYEGASSLRISYSLNPRIPAESSTSVPIAEVRRAPLPVLMSSAYAETLGARTSTRRPLVVGAEGTLELALPTHTASLDYRVVGIVEDFPALEGRFIVAPMAGLAYSLNTGNPSGAYLSWNTLWLNLDGRQPAESLRAQPDARFAWDTYTRLQSQPLTGSTAALLLYGAGVAGLLWGLALLTDGGNASPDTRQIFTALGASRAAARRWQVWENAAAIALILPGAVLMGVALASLLEPFSFRG